MQLPLSLLVIAGNEYIATSTSSIKFHEIIQTFTEGSSPASFNGVLPMKVVLGALYSRGNIVAVPIQVIRTVTRPRGMANVNTEIPPRGYYSTPEFLKNLHNYHGSILRIYTCPDPFVSVQETPFTLDEVTTARLWGHSPLLQQSDKTILHTRHDPRAVCLFEVLANNVHKDSTTFKSTRLNRSIFCFVSVMLCYDHYYTLRFTFPHTHTTDASLIKWHDNLRFQVY